MWGQYLTIKKKTSMNKLEVIIIFVKIWYLVIFKGEQFQLIWRFRR